MGDINAPPPGPLIPPSGEYQTLSVTKIKTKGSSSVAGPVSFFNADLATQQAGPSTQNDSGAVNSESDHDAIVSLTNSLHNYGLISHAPIFPGRTITFTNNTTNSPALILYLTVGAKGNTLQQIHPLPPPAPQIPWGTGSANAFSYTIPDQIGWSGNFQVWPVDEIPVNQLGANLFEISVNNQTYSTGGTALPLTDNWDISTVPPNVPDPQLDCGPRDQCVAASYTKITSPGTGYFAGYNLDTVNNGTGLVTGFAITTPGTGYVDGTIYHTSGGHGTGLRVIVNTASAPPTPGPITIVGISGPSPTGYKDGDVLTVVGGDNNGTVTLTVNESGTGSGLKVDLISVNGGSLMYPICSTTWAPSVPGQGGYTIRDFGADYDENDRLTVVQNTSIKLTDGGSGYSTATGVSATGGSGTTFTVDILRVSSGKIVELSVNTVTGSYAVGDSLTVSGGNTDATFDVLSVTPADGGILTIGDLTEDQSKSYNVGYQVTPPAPPDNTSGDFPPLSPISTGFWPPVVTTCMDIDGNCPQAITWPNDTVLPKSQTGYSQGNYSVSIIDPTIVVII